MLQQEQNDIPGFKPLNEDPTERMRCEMRLPLSYCVTILLSAYINVKQPQELNVLCLAPGGGDYIFKDAIEAIRQSLNGEPPRIHTAYRTNSVDILGESYDLVLSMQSLSRGDAKQNINDHVRRIGSLLHAGGTGIVICDIPPPLNDKDLPAIQSGVMDRADRKGISVEEASTSYIFDRARSVMDWVSHRYLENANQHKLDASAMMLDRGGVVSNAEIPWPWSLQQIPPDNNCYALVDGFFLTRFLSEIPLPEGKLFAHFQGNAIFLAPGGGTEQLARETQRLCYE